MGGDWAEQEGAQARITQNKLRLSVGRNLDMNSIELKPEVAGGWTKLEVAACQGLFLCAGPTFELPFARGGSSSVGVGLEPH